MNVCFVGEQAGQLQAGKIVIPIFLAVGIIDRASMVASTSLAVVEGSPVD